MRVLHLFLVLVLFFSSCQSQPSKQKMLAKDFYAQIQASGDKNIVDVRTPSEYNEGHINSADNIDWTGPDFEEFIGRYNRNTPLFIYCLSGGRSSNAAKKARSMGFKKVYELEGGMMAWRAASLPEVSPAGTPKDEMSLADFEALYKNKTKKIVIDFYADWCGPCKKMKPYLDNLSKTMASEVEIVRINADKHPKLCKELNVDGLPMMLMYQNNALVWSRVGYIDEQQLRNLISK